MVDVLLVVTRKSRFCSDPSAAANTWKEEHLLHSSLWKTVLYSLNCLIETINKHNYDLFVKRSNIKVAANKENFSNWEQ